MKPYLYTLVDEEQLSEIPVLHLSNIDRPFTQLCSEQSGQSIYLFS